MKTTRTTDLEQLEERGADKELIEKVYKQSKDPQLERARTALIEATRRNDHREIERIERHIRSIGR